MTAHPPRPKKPKPLVIKPGKYRTRDGRVAIVTGSSHLMTWTWEGAVGTNREFWTNAGRNSINPENLHPFDLIARIPDAKPKRSAKRKVEVARYHLNADLKWIADPKNQQAIKRMIKAAIKYMKRPVAQRRAGKGKS